MKDSSYTKLVLFILIVGILWVSWISYERSTAAQNRFAKRQHQEQQEKLACARGEYCTDFEGWRRSYRISTAVRLPTGEYYFQGYKCLQMCEGHIAGYQWAKHNEIVNYSRCTTQSTSFNRGCEIGVIAVRIGYGLPPD